MWALLELAMQFTIAMIAAHACVSSRPAFRFLNWLASRPDTDRPVQAVVLLGAFSLVVAYFNWAASVVASALFPPVHRATEPEGGHPAADRRRLSRSRHRLARRAVRLGAAHHGDIRKPDHDAAARHRSARRPLAAGDRDAVQLVQPDLPSDRVGRGARDGGPPAPASERTHAVRGRVEHDHAGDAGRRRNRPRLPAVSTHSVGGSSWR